MHSYFSAAVREPFSCLSLMPAIHLHTHIVRSYLAALQALTHLQQPLSNATTEAYFHDLRSIKNALMMRGCHKKG